MSHANNVIVAADNCGLDSTPACHYCTLPATSFDFREAVVSLDAFLNEMSDMHFRYSNSNMRGLRIRLEFLNYRLSFKSRCFDSLQLESVPSLESRRFSASSNKRF
jgi:hypothetical protein